MGGQPIKPCPSASRTNAVAGFDAVASPLDASGGARSLRISTALNRYVNKHLADSSSEGRLKAWNSPRRSCCRHCASGVSQTKQHTAVDLANCCGPSDSRMLLPAFRTREWHDELLNVLESNATTMAATRRGIARGWNRARGVGRRRGNCNKKPWNHKGQKEVSERSRTAPWPNARQQRRFQGFPFRRVSGLLEQ